PTSTASGTWDGPTIASSPSRRTWVYALPSRRSTTPWARSPILCCGPRRRSRCSTPLPTAAPSPPTCDDFLGLPPRYLSQSEPPTRDQKRAPGVRLELTTNGLTVRSEEHTSELQSRENLVCRLL